MERFLVRVTSFIVCCLLFVPTNFGVFAEEPPVINKGDVVINEVMWMGSDEWMELYNTTDNAISLTGWQIQNAGSGSAVITLTGTIQPHAYFLIGKNSTTAMNDSVRIDQKLNLSFLDGGEQLTLCSGLCRADNIIDSTPEQWLKVPAGKRQSIERVDGGWQNSYDSTTTFWKEAGINYGTPGAANSIKPANVPPVAKISGPNTGVTGQVLSFSAEDSTDLEGAALTFRWDFGDGDVSCTNIAATHVYKKEGSYDVIVEVSDGESTTKASLPITITKAIYPEGMVINELLPNPVGTDSESEFIELKNTSKDPIDLVNWKLSDEQHSFTIPIGNIVNAGELIVFPYSSTKISQNNSGDSIGIYDPSGALRSSATYDDQGEEGWSYSRTEDGQYRWTTTATQNEKNIFTDPPTKESKVKSTTKKTTVAKKSTKATPKPKGRVAAATRTTQRCQCTCPKVAGESNKVSSGKSLPSSGLPISLAFGAALGASLLLFGIVAKEPLFFTRRSKKTQTSTL